MAIQGLRATSDFVTDQRPKNWREGIMLLYRNGKAPLTALTTVMKSKSVDDPEYYWWDKALNTRRLLLNTAISAVATNLAITADGSTSAGALSVKEGDILYSEETGEYMRVAANPIADTGVVVQRGFAGSTATALDPAASGKNPYLLVVGSAYEEASGAPSGVNFDPTKRYNFTQIFRNTLEMSRTAIKTNLRTGDQVKEARRETLELHGIDMERAFWFGKRSESTLNGKPIRTCDGVINVIDSGNIKNALTDYPTGVTMSGLEEYLYNIFKFGSNEKMAFLGNRASLTIQQIVRKNTTYNIQFGVKEYGMNVARLTCPFGELVMKTHPLFNYVTGGTTATAAYYGQESWMFVLDMDNFTYVNLKDSDTKYEPKLETTGMDGMKSGYITEASIMIAHPVSHYLIKNLVSSAAG